MVVTTARSAVIIGTITRLLFSVNNSDFHHMVSTFNHCTSYKLGFLWGRFVQVDLIVKLFLG